MALSCISGHAGADYEGKTVYLRSMDGSVLDSCVVAGESFAFKGQMEKQTVCHLTSGWMKLPVLLQNGTDIKADFTSMPAMATDGGGMNSLLSGILKSVTDARIALMNKEDSLRDANAHPQAIDLATRDDYEAMYNLYRNAITENKDNLVGAYLLGVTARVLYPDLQVMDSTATSLSMDNRIPILVFALKDPYNIIRVLKGEKIGTTVKEA